MRKGSIGTVTNAWCGSPASLEKTHPDLFWYGVHGCESLFTVMGTGCQSVHRGKTVDGKIEVDLQPLAQPPFPVVHADQGVGAQAVQEHDVRRAHATGSSDSMGQRACARTARSSCSWVLRR